MARHRHTKMPQAKKKKKSPKEAMKAKADMKAKVPPHDDHVPENVEADGYEAASPRLAKGTMLLLAKEIGGNNPGEARVQIGLVQLSTSNINKWCHG